MNPFTKKAALGVPVLMPNDTDKQPVQPIRLPVRVVIELEVPAHPQATPDQVRQQVLPEISFSAMLAPCLKTLTVEAGLAKVL